MHRCGLQTIRPPVNSAIYLAIVFDVKNLRNTLYIVPIVGMLREFNISKLVTQARYGFQKVSQFGLHN